VASRLNGNLVIVHWLALLGFVASLGIAPEEYAQRRARLRQNLPESGIVLFGAPEQSHDPRSQLLQEPNFLYLTGWSEPGAILLLLPGTEVLFLPPRSERVERYEGRRVAAGDADAPQRTGVAKVLSTDIWESEAKRLLADVAHVYTLGGDKPRVQQLLEGREVKEAGLTLAGMRMVKSPGEVELLQRSIDVTLEAHKAAWKRVKPGVTEYQLGAVMTAVILENGCERHAYRPVIGSGPNSVVLHYSGNKRRMDAGEVLLMDVGAECGGYAADITRTVPVSGRFTSRQRQLYDLVLGAQKAAIAAVKPGASLGPRGNLLQVAKKYLDEHGAPVNGKPLSDYLTHGIGHHVGLEVHDAAVPTEPLAPGMVITIEPGIYLPEENIGIRIEDMVLVTENGGRVLSSGLPRTVEQVERRGGR
jgi:Xaa-Pro aminopeptidase